MRNAFPHYALAHYINRLSERGMLHYDRFQGIYLIWQTGAVSEPHDKYLKNYTEIIAQVIACSYICK